jgi:hypothetical protein
MYRIPMVLAEVGMWWRVKLCAGGGESRCGN